MTARTVAAAEAASSRSSRSSSSSRRSTAATASTSASTRRASLKRRAVAARRREELTTDLRPAGAGPARPGVHGAAAARPLGQRHLDVPRPDASTSRSARRSCRCCAPIRSSASGSPAARPARRSTRSRSCSTRRGSTTATRIYATDINEAVLEHGAGGVFPLDEDAATTPTTTSAPAASASFSEYYIAALRRRALRPVARARTSSSPSTTSSIGRLVQRVPRDRLPQRDDLLRRSRCRSACTGSSTRASALRRPRARPQGVARFTQLEDELRGARRRTSGSTGGCSVMTYELVVIGTSWGGLHALRRCSPGCRRDFALAVVVAQHRRPSRARRLAALLQRRRRCRCARPRTRTARPGAVYLAPPDYHLLVERRRDFALSIEAPVRLRAPVDRRPVRVGRRGVSRALRRRRPHGRERGRRGGPRADQRRRRRAIVQDPRTAERPEMPAAALEAIRKRTWCCRSRRSDSSCAACCWRREHGIPPERAGGGTRTHDICVYKSECSAS